jgi:hypothetical protein
MSITNNNAPFDIGFNVAVHRMQELYAPLGYAVVSEDKVPQSLSELKAHINRLGGVIPLGDFDYGNTIFGDAEIKLMLGAWAMSTYNVLNLELTGDNNNKVFAYMVWQLISCYPYEEKVKQWIDLLHAEMVGQCKHVDVYGMFPLDQRTFVREYIEHGEIVFTGNPY